MLGGVQGRSSSGAAGRVRGPGRAAGLWARGRWAVYPPRGVGTRSPPGAGPPERLAARWDLLVLGGGLLLAPDVPSSGVETLMEECLLM